MENIITPQDLIEKQSELINVQRKHIETSDRMIELQKKLILQLKELCNIE